MSVDSDDDSDDGIYDDLDPDGHGVGLYVAVDTDDSGESSDNDDNNSSTGIGRRPLRIHSNLSCGLLLCLGRFL